MCYHRCCVRISSMSIYLKNISEDINNEDTESDGDTGPCNHRASPFRPRYFRYIHCRWDRCHARGYTGNRSPNQDLYVTIRHVNGHPTRH